MINVHEIGTNIDGNRDQNPPEAKNPQRIQEHP